MTMHIGDGFVSEEAVNPKTLLPTQSTSQSINSALFLLVRIAPDARPFSLPFSRAITWDRLIHSLYQIYEVNNALNPKCTLEQAYSSIRVSYEESGARILGEFWAELVRPTMSIKVEFSYPFRPPPWTRIFTPVRGVKREEDTDMMEAPCWDTVSKLEAAHEEPVVAKLIEDANTTETTPNRTAAAPTESTATPNARSENNDRSETSTLANSSRTVSALSHVVASGSVVTTAHCDASQRTVSGTASPHSTRSASHPPQMADQSPGPDRESPSPSTNHIRRSSYGSETSDRPVKRKRGPSSITSQAGSDDITPTTRASSSGPVARGIAPRREPHSTNHDETRGRQSPRFATPSASRDRCKVLVQSALLLDGIAAGETIKIVQTEDGEIIALRQEEDVDTLRRKKRESLAMEDAEKLKGKELEKQRVSRKRAHDDDMEALIRIWSGGGVPPSKRVKEIHDFEKLTPEQKLKLNRLVRDHHIIRVDHFTAPYINSWKHDNMPEADEKQVKNYITDIATTIYNTEQKRSTGYRNFLEANEYSPRHT